MDTLEAHPSLASRHQAETLIRVRVARECERKRETDLVGYIKRTTRCESREHEQGGRDGRCWPPRPGDIGDDSKSWERERPSMGRTTSRYWLAGLTERVQAQLD
jgi:hypothetical protein